MLLVAASQLSLIFCTWILPTVIVAVLVSRRFSKQVGERVAAMLVGVLGAILVFGLLVLADKQGLWSLTLWGIGASLMVATGVSIAVFSAVRKRFAARSNPH